MEDTLGALGLVLNCVTLWNTVYLDRALTQLRAAGYPALDADVARLADTRSAFLLGSVLAAASSRSCSRVERYMNMIDDWSASGQPPS